MMVWAASEAKDGGLVMEEANTLKLALALARQRGWKDVQLQGTNRSLFQKLKSRDSNDPMCATIIKNIIDLTSLFCSCSFTL